MKYALTDNTKVHNGTTLYQIESLHDFGDVRKGDLGGYIQSEENLSQEGDAWVGGNAYVIDNAIVGGNAIIYDNAIVSDNALVYDNAEVRGNAWITGDSMIGGNAWVKDVSMLRGSAGVKAVYMISDNATKTDENTRKYKLTDNTKIHNGTTLYQIEALKDFGLVKKGNLGGYIQSERNLSHRGASWINRQATVSEDAEVSGNAWVTGTARVSGPVRLNGDTWLGDGQISSKSKYNNGIVSDKPWFPGIIIALMITIAFVLTSIFNC